VLRHNQFHHKIFLNDEATHRMSNQNRLVASLTHAQETLVIWSMCEQLATVRAIDTRGRTYDGHGRGGELCTHDEWMQECLANSEGLLDVATLRSIWAEMRDLPRGDTPDIMNHGDLIPPNTLVADGRLVGVLDVGGLGAADPALDLVSAWHLLDTARRQLLRDYVGSDDAEWQRGRAWAFQQALGAVWYYVDSSPTMSAGCRRTLERILADVRSSP
jgi:aminoglycoside phosphotransferase (APT) family kinase protein